jgi:hypothetical protein
VPFVNPVISVVVMLPDTSMGFVGIQSPGLFVTVWDVRYCTLYITTLRSVRFAPVSGFGSSHDTVNFMSPGVTVTPVTCAGTGAFVVASVGAVV